MWYNTLSVSNTLSGDKIKALAIDGQRCAALHLLKTKPRAKVEAVVCFGVACCAYFKGYAAL